MAAQDECHITPNLVEDDAPQETTRLLGEAPPPRRKDKEFRSPSISSLPLNEVEIESSIYLSQSHENLLSASLEYKPGSMSNIQCLMNLLKGFIGTGILAMPVAIKNGGLWTGTVCLLLLAAVNTNCMHMLVYCGHRLCTRLNVTTMDYGGVVLACLQTGPMRFRKLAPIARATEDHFVIFILYSHGTAIRSAINFFLILTQFGFCVVYIVFIARTIEEVVETFHPHSFSIQIYNVLVTVVIIPYSFVKSYSAMAPFSAFANVLNFAGLVIILQYIVRGLPNVSERPAVGSIDTFPLFFGTAIYAFEGIGMVLPLQNKMKNKEDFGGWTGIINLGMAIVTALYVAVGFYGYLQYGDEVKGSITLNLPSTQWLYLMVKVMFAVSIYISYGLQFYVPMEIIWPKMKTCFKSRKIRIVAEYIFRTLLVLVTFGLAAAVPHIDLLISFIGAFASSGLALMFPPLIELLTFSAEGEKLSYVTVLKCCIYFLIGFLGFATGTYASLRDIVNTFGATGHPGNSTYLLPQHM